MYVPPSFRIADPQTLAAFMGRYSFATLISIADGVPFASHLPIRFDAERGASGTLVAHLARANPQWQHFASDREVLAIFQGPHSYVSPSWYKAPLAVPTWNYATVHAYGVPRILEDHDRVVELLDETVTRYESAFERPWPGSMPADFRDNLIRSIVAFEIPVTRLEGKFKLGQNRSDEDLQGVFDALRHSSDQDKRELAALMQTEGLVAADNSSP